MSLIDLGIWTYRELVWEISLRNLSLSDLTVLGVTRLSTTQVVVVALNWLSTYLVQVKWQQVNVVLL